MVRWLIIAMVALSACAQETTRETPGQQAQEESPSPSPSPSPTPTFELTKSDIELELKILSKENFGSAGSIIEYRVEAGAPLDELPEDGVWEITYEIIGPEDGPHVGTFKLWGHGEYEADEGNVSTASTEDKLRIRVVEVEDVADLEPIGDD